MPRSAAELSAIQVNRLEKPGKHPVGGVAGLYLNVTATGARSWILRRSIAGKRHEIGLGAFPTVSLKSARELAREMVTEIVAGGDPLQARRERREAIRRAEVRRTSFDDAFEAYYQQKLEGELANEKHKAQWRATLQTYASPVIGGAPVADVSLDNVLKILQPIWSEKTETASRLRGRIEAVLDWARVNGLRDGENPARWKGNLDKILPSPSRVKKEENHPAVALEDAPSWFVALRNRSGIAAIALQFLTLTAARSGEIRGATWGELDLDRQLWTIPAARMKARREHRVPLPKMAVDLLATAPRFPDCGLVFPSSRAGKLSDMTLSAVMKRIQAMEVQQGRNGYLDLKSGRPAVPHGLRSTFRDWVAEKTGYPAEMAEVALAHNIGTKVQQAYLRGDMIERRRAMMEEWSRFLLP